MFAFFDDVCVFSLYEPWNIQRKGKDVLIENKVVSKAS